MKKSTGIGLMAVAMVFAAALASPAFAQSRQGEADFQRILSRHPELRANPGLMSDPQYLNHHPNLKEFLDSHPAVKAQAMSMGAYDRGHVWRDQSWWYHNDPNWIAQNRPNWIQEHPEWRNDGDWDDDHSWHDRSWWHEHRPDWVRAHRPDWAADKAKFEQKWEEKKLKAEAKWEKHHPNPNANPNAYPPHGHHHGHDND